MSFSPIKEGESEALPPTFGNLNLQSNPVSKRKPEDVEMEPSKAADIYCNSEQSDDDHRPIPDNHEPEVLNPSKAKFDKFLEDIRLREA